MILIVKSNIYIFLTIKKKNIYEFHWLLMIFLINFFQKDQEREDHVIDFIEQILHQRPKGDFDNFIRDAVILSK